MAFETVERIFQFLFEAPKLISEKLLVLWHAGEPLVMGTDYYEQAFSIIDQINNRRVNVEHAIQTNGTLLDQEWCDFIRHRSIKIGLSIDGPREIHDANRVDRHGRGTFDRALHAADLLNQNGIPFRTISVLGADGILQPDRLWEFLRQIGSCAINFNIEEIEGVNRTSSLKQIAEYEKLHRAFFKKLIFLREAESPEIFVRELDFMIDVIRNSKSDVRSTENTPFSIMTFDHFGNISTFSPELSGTSDPRYGGFSFGNVHKNEFSDLLSNQRFKTVLNDITAGVEQCRRSCEYFTVCGGGAPSNKLAENGTFNSTETMACRLRIQSISNVCIDYLEDEVTKETK